MRKNQKKTHPREISYSILSSGNAAYVRVDDNGYEMKDDLGNPAAGTLISTQMAYEGDRRRREVAKVYGEDYAPELLLQPKDFDNLYACDTNTLKNVCGEWNLSVSVVVEVAVEWAEEGKTQRIGLTPLFAIEWLWQGVDNIEPVAWGKAMTILTERFGAGNRCGLIVDSQMDILSEYNLRRQELPGGATVPENFTLFYASADRSGTYMNAAMKFCDRSAGEILSRNKMNIMGRFASRGMNTADKRHALYARFTRDPDGRCWYKTPVEDWRGM